MMNQQFLLHEAQGYPYVNREDDAGQEGLRKAKLSYHPAFMVGKRNGFAGKGGSRMRGWEKNVRRTVPYVPGEQPKEKDIIKLNTNENPYPPAPGVEAVLRGMEPADFRKYPDPSAGLLTEAIAESYGFSPDEVFVGVGSDDVLAMAFLTFFNSEKAHSVSGYYLFFLRRVGGAFWNSL